MGQIGGFVKNVFFEQSKRITLLGISILYSYFIANFLGPKDYGLVIYFINFSGSIISLFGVAFVQGMINIFTPKYKSKKQFYNLLKIQYAIIMPIVFGLFIFSEKIVSFLGKDNPVVLQWAAILLLIMPIYTSYLYLTKAFKRFGTVFKAETIMGAVNFCLAFTLIIFFQQGLLGVIFAQIMAAVLALSFLVYFSRNLKFEEHKMPKGELKKYVTPALSGSFIIRAYDFVNYIIIGMFVDNIMLGYYYLVKKMSDVIMGASMSSLQDVLMPYIMEKHEDRKSLGNFISLNIKSGLIMSSLVGLIIIISSQLVLQLFFPDYVLGWIIIPFIVLNSVISSLRVITYAFIAINEIKYNVIANIIAIIISLAISLILVTEFGIFAILTGGIIYSLISGLLLFYYSKKYSIPIEIIPRKKDITFFIKNIKLMVNTIKIKFKIN